MGNPPPTLSIILPAKNEAEGLRGTLPALKAAYPEAEIIVVDDGSTDATAQIAAEQGARVLSSPYSMGNGAAIKRGARAASGEILVFMDADGQHGAGHVRALLDKLGEGYDMVVGARDRSGQANVHRGLANAFYQFRVTRGTQADIVRKQGRTAHIAVAVHRIRAPDNGNLHLGIGAHRGLVVGLGQGQPVADERMLVLRRP